jgi:hypothetical protein
MLVLALLVLCCGSIEAGRRDTRHDSGPDALFEEYVAQLGLADETLATIRAIVDASRKRGEELREELHQARLHMRQLLSQEKPDETAVMQQADVIGALELAERKNRLRALLQIRAFLTPGQRQALLQLHEEFWPRPLTDVPPACQADVASFCTDVPLGHARTQCLHDHTAELSPECKARLQEVPARRGRKRGVK